MRPLIQSLVIVFSPLIFCGCDISIGEDRSPQRGIAPPSSAKSDSIYSCVGHCDGFGARGLLVR